MPASFSLLLRETSFRRQLSVTITAGVVALAICLSLASSWQGSSRIRDIGVAQGRHIAENLADQSKLALLYDSAENTTAAVALTLAFPDVVQVEIRDTAGRAVVDTATRNATHGIDNAAAHLLATLRQGRGFLEGESENTWRFVAPVLSVGGDSPFEMAQGRDELLGYVRIVQSKDTLTRTKRNIFIANLGISFLFTLAFILLIRILAGRLMRPLGLLADAMNRATSGAEYIQAEVDGPKDIANMALVFNSMMSALQSRERELLQARDEAMRSARVNADLASTVSRVNAELEADNALRLKAEAEVRDLNAKLEQRVIRRTAELEAANRELSAFAYSVSHDLRAPLRRIEGFTQLLAEDYARHFDERGNHALGRIRAGAHDMAEMIDSFLKLSRSTRGDLQVDRVDLTAVANSIVTELRDRAPDRRVSVDIQPGLSTEGDVRLIKVALGNLLANAWKYTRKNPDAHIEFGMRVEGDQHIYFVRDNGVGFDMAHSSRLFTPFGRLHRQDEFEGNGIGLATVQRIVARHGGRVWGEGDVGVGATFYFTCWEAKDVMAMA